MTSPDIAIVSANAALVAVTLWYVLLTRSLAKAPYRCRVYADLYQVQNVVPCEAMSTSRHFATKRSPSLVIAAVSRMGAAYSPDGSHGGPTTLAVVEPSLPAPWAGRRPRHPSRRVERPNGAPPPDEAVF